MEPIRELVISGGGIRGIAFVAALVEMDSRGLLDLKRISSASIGTFIAMCLMVGYTPKELLDALWTWPLDTLKDPDLDNFVKNRSILKGDRVRNFFVEILSKKRDIKEVTLGDLCKLSGIELYVSVCCVDTRRVEYISHTTHPHIKLLTLLMMTTAVPGIFPPVKWEGKLYVDGGLVDNCPVSLLSDRAWSIRSTKTIEPVSPGDSLLGYFIAVIRIFYDSTIPQGGPRTIEIDTGRVGITSFGLSIDQKMAMVVAGRNAVSRMFPDRASPETAPGE